MVKIKRQLAAAVIKLTSISDNEKSQFDGKKKYFKIRY